MNLKSKINVPNCITSLRIIGAICMAFTKILTPEFFVIYTLCGVTDVLDGFIARMTKKTTEFGAKLDSVADLLFYGIMLIKLLPELLSSMPKAMPCMIVSLVLLRLISYGIAAIKHKKFASLHTYMNKLTGLACFSIPYMIHFFPHHIVYIVVYVIAVIAALEEILIHIKTPVYNRTNRHVIKVVKENKKHDQ